MQPAGWERPSGPDAPPAWGSAPQPGWGDQAPGFANPAPTWGPPGAGAPWSGSALDEADEPRRVGGTIAAHLVLWLGLIAAAAAYEPLIRPLIDSGASYRTTFTVSAVVLLLPVVVGFVLAGRSASLRVLGGLTGLLVLGVDAVFVLWPAHSEIGWVPRIAAYVLGLGAWMVARRHARSGLLLLVPLALLLLLWFPRWGPAPQVAGFLLDQGVRSPFLLALWNYLPIVVTAGLGLLSSVLRPRATRAGDGIGWVVWGGLTALLVVTVAANQLVGDRL